jgi:hypothetical protein
MISMNLTSALEVLNQERDRLTSQITGLDAALDSLRGVGNTNGFVKLGRRKLSAAAKARIIAAQKKRWATWRRKHKKAA